MPRRPLKTTAAAIAVAAALIAPSGAAAATSYSFNFAFGAPGAGAGQFSQPQGIAVDPSNGAVFVADTNNHRIEVFNAAGQFQRQWGSLGSGPAQFTNPEGVGVSPVAPFDVYVADTNDNRVERFTNGGTFVSAFGTNGSGNAQMEFPRNIAFDPQGNVYVGDTGFNNRVTKWAPDGTFQTIVSGAGAFTRLGGLTSSATQLFASDSSKNLVTRFGFDGSGSTALQSGVLNNPQGLAVDPTGDVFAADAGNHRIAVFDGSGAFSGSFGSIGAAANQFQDPSDVAFASSSSSVYALEGNNCCTKVSVWQQLPTPVLGQSMDINTDKGTVLYKPPGARKFTKLTKVSLVKSGTIIDARHGTVGITSLTASGQLQSADFYSGIFKAVQKAQGKGLTDAQLFGGNFKPCPAGLRAAKVPQTVRQLWGSGKGQFRTRGRFASASIRGTTWLTQDRCDGTLIRVTQGAVTVRDLVKNATIVVKAGHQYFARARRG